ncbi:MAG: ATP-binding protein [Acidobacteria bacterium]|nr:ATP-binding protein [Acidobacteriota bacterium]
MRPRTLAAFASLAFAIGAARGAATGVPAPGYNLRTWGTDDGLPSDAVIDLAQTPDGYLWAGTNAGLARFDGVRFTVFDRRNTPELPSDQCGPLLVTKEGLLWIGAMGGAIARYDGRRFTTFGRAEGSKFEYATYFLSDAAGRLWIGTNDLLHMWDGSRFRTFPAEGADALPRGVPVIERPKGSIWVRGLNGRLRFVRDGAVVDAGPEESRVTSGLTGGVARPARGRGETILWIQNQPVRITKASNGKLESFDVNARTPTDQITGAVETTRGELWVGLRESGIRVIEGGAVSVIGEVDGLPSGRINGLLEDREGNIWAGTSGGLTRIRPRPFSSWTGATGLPEEKTWAIFEDHRGDIWAGTETIAERYHGGAWIRYSKSDGLPGAGVVSFAEDRDGLVWIGTTSGLASFDGFRFTRYGVADGLPHDNIRALMVDREGRLWIGTSAGGAAVRENGMFRAYGPKDGLAGNWVRFIHEDASGDIWFATTSGVSRLHAGAFTTFTTKDGLADDRVLAIAEDGDGGVWFGTYREGLSRYRDGRFTTVSTAQGLFDDTILRILEDSSRRWWMSSARGVFRVDVKALEEVADGRARRLVSVAFDRADGLPTTDCGGGTQPSGWRARDGSLWFPTSRGLAVVDPSRVRANEVPPHVLLEEVLLDQARAPEPSAVKVPAGTRRVELHFTATSLSAPDRVRFRYRLEGFDPDWIDAGSRRVAYYTGLRPASYKFRVAAANESGVPSESEATADVTVLPFFYETAWFYFFCAALAAAAAFAAYRYRVRQIEARYGAVVAERERIARELHDTIAQGFTGVSMQLEAAASRLADLPDSARENLDRARLLVRSSLADARRSVRDLRPNLLESADLPASLRAVASELTAGTDVRAEVTARGFRGRLAPRIEDALFRIGQEAMTNAIRHGRCRHLRVELSAEGGRATLAVRDDGAGFDPAATPPGSGMTGMRERMRRIGGEIRFESRPGAGTTIEAAVPLGRGGAADET